MEQWISLQLTAHVKLVKVAYINNIAYVTFVYHAGFIFYFENDLNL